MLVALSTKKNKVVIIKSLYPQFQIIKHEELVLVVTVDIFANNFFEELYAIYQYKYIKSRI